MKKYTKATLLLVILLLLGFGFWGLKLRDKETTIQNEEVAQQISASLKINDGANTQSFDISGFVGKTALEATQANVKVTATGMGTNTFVTGLGKRIADTKKHEFWELDANGTETQVGAASYIIKNGDKIEWKMNTY
jgi:hypothetical protein